MEHTVHCTKALTGDFNFTEDFMCFFFTLEKLHLQHMELTAIAINFDHSYLSTRTTSSDNILHLKVWKIKTIMFYMHDFYIF